MSTEVKDPPADARALPATVTGLRCVGCGTVQRGDLDVQTLCETCGGVWDVEYDYDAIQAAAIGAHAGSLHRLLLPLTDWSLAPTLELGQTPLEDAPAVAAAAGVARLRVKDDGRLPTGCLKDRASWLGVCIARQIGYRDIVCASTGNAASSLAGMAASAGLRAHILVPATVSPAKLAQARAFGADVVLVDAPYDDVYYLCNDVAQASGWYNRNCAINPFLVEGKKLSGLELGEQLAPAPADWLAVSVGDGCTIAAVWKGLTEMRRLGTIERLPRLLGVQAAGANPIATAFAGDGTVRTQPAETLAGAISVGRPRNAPRALAAVAASDGSFASVPDDEILTAQALLASSAGIFAEPGSAASLAGVIAARKAGTIAPDESVVVINTGNGLKDPPPAGVGGLSTSVPCDLQSVQAAFAALGERATRE